VRLTDQIKQLQLSVNQAEQEGVSNPLETITILKQLKASLHTVSLELATCPQEADAEAPRQEQPKPVHAKQTLNHWFKEEEAANIHVDEEEQGLLIDDER
jgi:hypothetical protein